MAKKATPAPAPAPEPAPPEGEPAPGSTVDAPAPEASDGAPAHVDAPEEKAVEDEPKEKQKEEKAPAAPVVEADDDISFVLNEFKKQLIAKIDPSIKDQFWLENEGKSLKQKAAWLAAHPVTPKPDPQKGLGKGPAGGDHGFSCIEYSKAARAKK